MLTSVMEIWLTYFDNLLRECGYTNEEINYFKLLTCADYNYLLSKV